MKSHNTYICVYKSKSMKRREFLKAMAVAGMAATYGCSGSGNKNKLETMSQKGVAAPGGNYDLVAVMGGEPDVMFRKAIVEAGGMSRYVKPGNKVVVKPNIGWDKRPEFGANTHPALVREIVKQCFEAGASEVVVFDHTCDNWRLCYANSGIEAAAKAEGAKVLPGNEESYYSQVELPKGKSLKSALIHKAILDCDVWLNVPVLKNHGGAQMTIAMKNLMGIVWDRGYFHQNDLQQCIADCSTLDKKPVLNIIDAYRVMLNNGPRGTNQGDVVITKALILSTDIVAADTAATRFFNQLREMPLENVPYLAKAQELRLGTMNVNNLKVKKIKL